jgi:transglutaminase-like putative cysteine protease
VIYDIGLRISYDYAGSAASGLHLLCLMPRDLPGQQDLLSGRIDIAPAPDDRRDRLDFFANPVVDVALRQAHAGIAVTLRARVARHEAGLALQPGRAERLGDLGRASEAGRSLAPEAPVHFQGPSALAPDDPAMAAFARALTGPRMPADQAVLTLGRALHRHMRFDAQATSVDTPAAEAFARRKGVCQDYSHILIACLRAVGVPAAYVSGYLRTIPPPGQPRLEGADAMHAWVRAWCGPAAGWIEFDPTNDCRAGLDHVVVARGRDYGDVAPIRGILRVAGGQSHSQSVDVVPAGPEPLRRP